MILFLDSSTLLSAAGSTKGAARFVILEAKARRWELVSSDYCAEETRRNLTKLGRSAATAWAHQIAPLVPLVRASLTMDKALLFPKAKDRPVVITALAVQADWLLTLDETDFHGGLAPRFTACGWPPPASFCWSSAPRACFRRPPFRPCRDRAEGDMYHGVR
jgi:predicted nucleic acid-binding protein